MFMRRRVQHPVEDATHKLLCDLIETPVSETRVRPVLLRSVVDQRRAVLAPYPLKNWFDRALVWGERLLGVVVVVFFCWWLADGYGRDWWHARQVEQPVTLAAPAAAPASLPHPELGASLPVVEDDLHRPSVNVDYLTPARMYVAPLLPTPTPVPEATPRPQPVDLRPVRVQVPAMELDSKVVEVFVQNGAWQVADYAVGYHHGTGVVGYGNMVMAGHKGLRGSVFARLEQLKVGDEVIVEAAGQRFQYRVRTTGSVWPHQVDVMFPTEKPQLTMLTCTNWDTQRFIVIADFIGAMPPPAAAGGN
ncbi:MAG TPA: sortase [Herpetosiphonaceae bacterium]